jgi:uncharacterized damage-inducible protein DinB
MEGPLLTFTILWVVQPSQALKRGQCQNSSLPFLITIAGSDQKERGYRLMRNPQMTIIEEIRTQGSAGEAGGSDPLFSCDRIKCTRADISRCLQLLNYTRVDLDKIISKIPTEELDWKPRSEPRSVRNVLDHVAQVDIWYLSRIRADPRLERSRMKDVFEFLDYARSRAHEVLPRLTTEQRSRTFRPKKWSDSPWPWTATKVLHRLVGHERQHTRYLQRILRVPDNH